MSPSNGILLNGVLRPKLLHIPLVSCFLINLVFLPTHVAHFDNIIVLSFLVYKILRFISSIFFLHFR